MSDQSREPDSAIESSPFLVQRADPTSDGGTEAAADDRDSGIQGDGDFLDQINTVEYKPGWPTELVVDPLDDVAQNWSRRSSIVSRQSAVSEQINPKDELCGWGPFSPSLCQKFRNPKWVVVWLSLAGVCQGMIVNGFVLNSISTIERRFDLKSSETGVIASGYDFASLVCLIPVSYFGGVGRKPHWVGIGVFIMGLGSMLFMLPHFTTDVYLPLGGSNSLDTCLRNAPNTTGVDDCKRGLLSNYKYVFLFGQLLHGIGASPLYTLGVSYLDDNLLPAATSLYVAIFYTLSILGPAAGFLLGGVFLNIYTDAASVDAEASLQLTTKSPKWVGAWWIGFIIAACMSLSVSLVLCGFPKYLPGRKEVQKLKVSEAHGGQGQTTAFSGRLNEFPQMLKKLLTNPTFVFVSLAGTMEGLILSGFATFAPKFVQNQFSTTASFASVIVGAIAVPAGGGGTFFGGWVIKKKNLKLKGIVKLCIVFAAASFFLCFGYLIQCKSARFAGVTGQSAANLVASCNEDCRCSRELYSPICGADQVQYFSPCHAGCVGAGQLKPGVGKMYGNCSCIPDSLVLDESTGHQAQEGRCSVDCDHLLAIFLLFFFGVTVFTFLASMPALSATLRSVPENQKSFALGIQWLIVRAFGTIPAGPMIGGIIDLSCILWQEECGERGSCYAYDNEKMGLYLMTAGLVVKFFSVLFLILTYIVYKPPPEPTADEVDESPPPEIDFMSTQEDVRGSDRRNSHNEITEL